MGRFGAFWASRLAEHAGVSGFTRNQERVFPAGVKRISESELSGFDAVFLCCAISAVEEVLERIKPYIKPGTVVLDTCSVKIEPATQMQRILPEDVEVIATHPMFGPDSGRNGVQGLPIVYSPVRASEETAAKWYDFLKSMGLHVIEMTPDEHDQEAAFTQGVTHFIGRVLDQLKLQKSPIATVGYQKLQEIVEQTCNDPMQLFLDLQRHNPHTKEMRARLKKALDDTLSLF